MSLVTIQGPFPTSSNQLHQSQFVDDWTGRTSKHSDALLFGAQDLPNPQITSISVYGFSSPSSGGPPTNGTLKGLEVSYKGLYTSFRHGSTDGTPVPFYTPSNDYLTTVQWGSLSSLGPINYISVNTYLGNGFTWGGQPTGTNQFSFGYITVPGKYTKPSEMRLVALMSYLDSPGDGSPIALGAVYGPQPVDI